MITCAKTWLRRDAHTYTKWCLQWKLFLYYFFVSCYGRIGWILWLLLFDAFSYRILSARTSVFFSFLRKTYWRSKEKKKNKCNGIMNFNVNQHIGNGIHLLSALWNSLFILSFLNGNNKQVLSTKIEENTQPKKKKRKPSNEMKTFFFRIFFFSMLFLRCS